jgi:group I intron endonuclease
MKGIYRIISPSGSIYIGQTKDHVTRFRNYKYIRCLNQRRIYNSLLKHGFSTHIIELIHILPEDASQEVINNYEIFYWKQYKDCGFEMMNIKEPGSNGSHSEETKKKISLRNKGYKFTEEQKKNLSMAKKGSKLSEEHKQKLSDAGKKAHAEGKTFFHGKKQSKEFSELISNLHKGKKNSPETLIKMSEAAKKRGISEETKAKMIAGRKRYLENKKNNI